MPYADLNTAKSGGTPCRFKRGGRWIAAYAHQKRGRETYVTPRAESKFFPFYVATDTIRFVDEASTVMEWRDGEEYVTVVALRVPRSLVEEIVHHDPPN